jgi:antitoxin (DNA-binding transcriptional repressor) of toxin-antitoxin stability system
VRTWETNADEYAELDRGEGWPFAALVACSVSPGEGNGGDRRSGEFQRYDRTAESSTIKVSAARFAERAGTSHQRILRYLDGWKRAADAGIVPAASELQPSDVSTVQLPDAPWSVYSASHDRSVKKARRQAIMAHATEAGVGASKVVNIVANPRALTTAIKADPATAEVARQALDAVAAGDEVTATNDTTTVADGTDVQEQLRVAAARNPQSTEMLGPPTGINKLIGNMRHQLRLIHEAAINPRIAWGGMREPVSQSLRQVARQTEAVAEIVRDPDSGILTADDLSQLLKETR